MKLCFLINLSHLRLYTVCLGILIVSLNTTFSHFFMYTPRFKKMFGHGNFVLKSWKSPVNALGMNPEIYM